MFLLVAAAAGLTALFIGRLAPSASTASSHREAPLISEDPTADNTDLYAFRSPDKPSTFTVVSNWIPGEDPAAGPNYYTFSQSARYNIYLDRNGDGRPDVTYTFRFKTPTGPYFLGNTQQSWVATRNGKAFAKGKTPINNIGPRFNGFVGVKDYEAAAEKTIVHAGGVSIFAGQRDDPFFADVGAIFDLVAIRKAGTTGNMGGGKDFLSGYNVHTIALQIPIAQVAREEQHRRRLDVDGPPERHDQRQAAPRLDAGLPPRQPADQRGRDPDGEEGLLEPHQPRERRAVQAVLHDPDPGRRAEHAVQARRPDDGP